MLSDACTNRTFVQNHVAFVALHFKQRATIYGANFNVTGPSSECCRNLFVNHFCLSIILYLLFLLLSLRKNCEQRKWGIQLLSLHHHWPQQSLVLLYMLTMVSMPWEWELTALYLQISTFLDPFLNPPRGSDDEYHFKSLLENFDYEENKPACSLLYHQEQLSRCTVLLHDVSL